MIQTVIYFILLSILTIYVFINKNNLFGKILLLYYTVIGAFAVYVIKEGLFGAPRVTLLPYLFLVISYIIFLAPFLKKHNGFVSKKVSGGIDKRFRIFLVIYIVFTILSIYNFVPYLIELMKTGDWLANYDAENVFIYKNWFFWLATQISSYTSLLAIILGFLYLRQKKYRVLAYITIGIYALSKISSSIYISSRGMIVDLAFVLLFLFIFVFPQLRKSTKRFIALIFTIGVIAISGYMVDVTVSRFSQGGAIESIIRYLGHPPIVFNFGIATIDKLSWGKYTLGALFGDSYVNQAFVGGSWGTAFYTFVGWLYIDWGPIGVILLGFTTYLVMNHMISKSHYEVSDLFAIFYYLFFLSGGALVIGPAQIINILMAILLYVMIKLFIENNHIRIKKKEI